MMGSGTVSVQYSPQSLGNGPMPMMPLAPKLATVSYAPGAEFEQSVGTVG